MCDNRYVKMSYFKVISLLQIEGGLGLWKEWEKFQYDGQKEADLSVEIQMHTQWKYRVRVLGNQLGNTVLMDQNCLLSISGSWNRAKLTLLSGRLSDTYKILNALLFTHLSTRNAIEMHSSLVDINGKGIMFLGPSGIGKTTQAELWMKYRKAKIINGDMVFVKQEAERFLGCGSPWHGSSPYCLNKQVPLSALVVLKQSNENSIRCLSGFEMVSSVMNSVFFPTWYEEGHEAVCKTLDTLLNLVPVYELSCRPDEDAVCLTEKAIFI